MNVEIKKCERCEGDFCTSPCYFDRQPIAHPPTPPAPPEDRSRSFSYTSPPPGHTPKEHELVLPNWLFGLICAGLGYYIAYLIHA